MEKAEDTQIDTNLYSRQIGTFGLETMGKLIKMEVVVVGLRGLGVEIAKNLILAGPKSVTLYDPEITKINDLGSNFYLEQGHVGSVSRADASVTKLRELNQYVKVNVITDLEAHIKSGGVHVVCQSEMILDGKVINPQDLDKTCRENKSGYISTQAFGPWGYAFVDFGDNHIVTDHDGEQTKNFIVTMIEKGGVSSADGAAKEGTTRVTCHEDKRHIF